MNYSRSGDSESAYLDAKLHGAFTIDNLASTQLVLHEFRCRMKLRVGYTCRLAMLAIIM